jgi:hypothetical protein
MYKRGRGGEGEKGEEGGGEERSGGRRGGLGGKCATHGNSGGGADAKNEHGHSPTSISSNTLSLPIPSNKLLFSQNLTHGVYFKFFPLTSNSVCPTFLPSSFLSSLSYGK